MEENEQAYRLEVEALELGPDTRAVAVELVTRGTLEPPGNSEAAPIWAALIPALCGDAPWVFDFFAHLVRVRDFCRDRNIAFREPNSHAVVIPAPERAVASLLLERFAGERFGVRAGGQALSSQPELEKQIVDRLAAKGVDAYESVYHDCLFCAICDLETGSLTVLSDKLWASEVIRRARPSLKDLGVEVTRPD